MERIPLQARLNALPEVGPEGASLAREDSVADFFEGTARESRSPYPRWVMEQLRKNYRSRGEPLSGGVGYLALVETASLGARQEEAEGEPGPWTELLYRLTIEPFTLLENDQS